jgi:hypothetical protein
MFLQTLVKTYDSITTQKTTNYIFITTRPSPTARAVAQLVTCRCPSLRTISLYANELEIGANTKLQV